MKNTEDKQKFNGAAKPAKGVKPSTADEHKNEIKEDKPHALRPKFGANAGPNTSSRADQLPILNDGGVPKDDDI